MHIATGLLATTRISSHILILKRAHAHKDRRNFKKNYQESFVYLYTLSLKTKLSKYITRTFINNPKVNLTSTIFVVQTLIITSHTHFDDVIPRLRIIGTKK